jgi:tRNA-Thr(GGU) m(6)t(6)A37 methyltransferase TsaA
MNTIQYRPIGIIHTPYKTPQGTPIQPPASKGVAADVEVFENYAEGLTDLEGFSHIYLIYHFHLSKKFSLMVKPFLDDESHGLFATRAPSRPNAIGLSIVELIGTEKNILRVKNIDVLDGTPLLDIKPYVPGFDIRKVHNIGWMEKKIENLDAAEDDGRFAE